MNINSISNTTTCNGNPLIKNWEKVNILLFIYILGGINIYNIIKYGIVLNSTKFILIITENNILIGIILSIAVYIIYFSKMSIDAFIDKQDGVNTSGVESYRRTIIEYWLLLILGILGGNMILLSNDLIMIYLGIELYSFTIYILIINKENKITKNISIFYLLISSLSTGILLLGFILIYKNLGSLNIEIINQMLSLSTEDILQNQSEDNKITLSITLVLIALIFKLGLIPFSYWMLRVYRNLDVQLIIYQLIVPKIYFFYILLKFIENFNNIKITNFLYIIGILSLIFGSIGGIIQKKVNSILAYSSILNMSFLIISIALSSYGAGEQVGIQGYLLNNNLIGFLSYISSYTQYFQYILIYIINIIGIYGIFIITQLKVESKIKYLSLIIIVLSFIGIPPLSGFYGKLGILMTYCQPFFLGLVLTNSLTNIIISTIILFIIGTILSSIYYFKFIGFDSLNPLSKSKTIIKEQNSTSFILSIIIFITVSYGAIMPYIYPYLLIIITL